MKPTDILSSEHRVIEQVLYCLDKMTQICQSEHKLDRQSAKDALDFFRNFADRCHHDEEGAFISGHGIQRVRSWLRPDRRDALRTRAGTKICPRHV